MIFKIGVLKNFAKFTGKHLCQSFFLNKDVELKWTESGRKKMFRKFLEHLSS